MECKCSAECKPANEILEALNQLHVAYPDEYVAIKAMVKPQTSLAVRYTAIVGDDDTVYAFDQETPDGAVQQLMGYAGDRSKIARLTRRIAKLKAEIAELEGK